MIFLLKPLSVQVILQGKKNHNKVKKASRKKKEKKKVVKCTMPCSLTKNNSLHFSKLGP